MATGTVRKFMYDDISYDVAADADLEETITEFENSLIVTSGKSLLKQEKRAQQVNSLVLITNGNDRERLRSGADGGEDLPMSYTDREGNTYRYVGNINVESNQTMESRTSVQILPTEQRTAALA